MMANLGGPAGGAENIAEDMLHDAYVGFKGTMDVMRAEALKHGPLMRTASMCQI